MSFAIEPLHGNEEAEERRSRIVQLVFRIIGLVTLGGAMWIILWIDNRPNTQTPAASAACDGVHCKCSRAAQDGQTGQRP